MDRRLGRLICPDCGKSGMRKYLFWESINDDKDKNKALYIFFYEEERPNKWKCWSLCNFCGVKNNSCCDPCGICKSKEKVDEDDYNQHCIKCLGFALISPFLIIFGIVLYPLFFIWFDIYFGCITKKKMKIVCDGDCDAFLDEKDNIWKNLTVDKYNEEFWNNYSYLFLCLDCKKKAKTFHEFIDNDIIIEENNTNIIDVSSANLKQDQKKYGNIIKVNFIINGQKNKISIQANSHSLFSEVINHLFEKIPEYKNKNCTFVYNNKIMELNYTMEKNNYKSGENIIINIK